MLLVIHRLVAAKIVAVCIQLAIQCTAKEGIGIIRTVMVLTHTQK